MTTTNNNLKPYKVLGMDGTDEDFDVHQEAFDFCEDLDTYPKAVYKRISEKKIGPLNVWARQWDGDEHKLVHLIHASKGYVKVVI